MLDQIDDIIRHSNRLKLWRQSQFHQDEKTHVARPMRQTDAAQALGVPVQTYALWEKYVDEGGSIPSESNMVKIYVFTQGQVRPDHFYRLPELRAVMREAISAAQRFVADEAA